MPRTNSLAIILIAVLIGFQAGFVFQADSPVFEPLGPDSTENDGNTTLLGTPASTFNVTIDGDSIDTISDLRYSVFQSAKDSVVSISTYRQTSDGLQQQASGSGFIYDSQGHIVTNNHVIDQGNVYDITMTDGSVYEAEVVGTDPYTDLAVLQIDAATPAPLPLGNSSALRETQTVLAIGAPFGLPDSVTQGIVSATDRRIPATEGFSIPNVIQTDAAINPGNSGGPLLNLQGQVIGVNTAIDTQSRTFSGVGFAVPSNTVRRVVPSLIQDGEYDHPWIGVRGIDITPPIADEIGLDQPRGFLIISVVADSPADQAGLQGGSRSATIRGQNITLGGDVITAIDGQSVSNIDDILTILAKKTAVGDTITITVIRDGQRRQLDLTLAERPQTS